MCNKTIKQPQTT